MDDETKFKIFSVTFQICFYASLVIGTIYYIRKSPAVNAPQKRLLSWIALVPLTHVPIWFYIYYRNRSLRHDNEGG